MIQLKMTDKSKQYLIGELKIKGRQAQDRGVVHDLKGRVVEYLKNSNLSGASQVRIKDNKVLVYGDPTIDAINRFVAQSNHGKIQVDFVPYTRKDQTNYASKLESTNLGLQTQLGSLSQENSKLVQKLSASETQVGALSEDIDNLQRKYNNLEVKVGTKDYEIPSSPDELSTALEINKGVFEGEMEGMITKIFYTAAEHIEKTPLWDLKGFNKAKEILEERKGYMEQHGESAVEDLPENIQKNLSEMWKDAGQIIQKHEQALAQSEKVDVPIRIANQGDKKIMIIPVDPKSKTPSARKLYETLLTFGGRMPTSADVRALDGEFATLEFGTGGLKYSTIKSYIEKGFSSDNIGMNITPYIFETQFYNVSGIPPGTFEAEKTENLVDFINNKVT